MVRKTKANQNASDLESTIGTSLLDAINSLKTELKADFDRQIDELRREIASIKDIPSVPSICNSKNNSTVISVPQPINDIEDDNELVREKDLQSDPRKRVDDQKYERFIRGSVIERFNANNGHQRAETWIALYERVSVKLNNDERIDALISYLTGDALTWFGDEIASKTYMWSEVKQRFLERFSIATVAPLVAASQLRMNRSDTVQSYAQEKWRLLRLTDASVKHCLPLMTDGMPNEYRTALYSANPTTYEQWLQIALSIEASNKDNRFKSFQNKSSVHTTYQTFNRTKEKSFNARNRSHVGNKPSHQTYSKRSSSPPPPTPCRFCTDLKLEDTNHWHSKCPNHSLRTTIAINKSKEKLPLRSTPPEVLNFGGGPHNH
jgi:hypothetical protein